VKVILEQWFSALQLLPKDFRNVLIGQALGTNHLACMWRVRMKEEESIKGEGDNERGGSKSREKHYSNQETKL